MGYLSKILLLIFDILIIFNIYCIFFLNAENKTVVHCSITQTVL